MLILTRKPGEKITIGESIVISVLEIRGSQVRLGISAPQAVAVHRSEIYERIRDENVRAGSVALSQAGALSERLRAIFPRRPLLERSADDEGSRTDGGSAGPTKRVIES